MVGVGELESKTEKLLNEEKQMRLNGEVAGTKKAVTEILQLYYDARAWKTLNDQIVLLSKRRGQLKQAITTMVQQAIKYIDETPDIETKTKLIKTLNSVSPGKIYDEIEQARLIKTLAKIKEEQGNITKATDLIQEVAVETFGAMSKTEKLTFILDQVPEGWDKLFVSIVSVETDKKFSKSNKAPVRNGACQLMETLSESLWIPQDDYSNELEEILLKLVISMVCERSLSGSGAGPHATASAQFISSFLNNYVHLYFMTC